MAFVQNYVSALAGGGGDGAIGTPWTLAESIASLAAGEQPSALAVWEHAPRARCTWPLVNGLALSTNNYTRF